MNLFRPRVPIGAIVAVAVPLGVIAAAGVAIAVASVLSERHQARALAKGIELKTAFDATAAQIEHVLGDLAASLAMVGRRASAVEVAQKRAEAYANGKAPPERAVFVPPQRREEPLPSNETAAAPAPSDGT